MPTTTKSKPKKAKHKKPYQAITVQVEAIKQGRLTLMPIPLKLLKTLKVNPKSKLYWTAVDGILQLSTQFPVMVIPILDCPEKKFEAQK